jgi:hypothetical protein
MAGKYLSCVEKIHQFFAVVYLTLNRVDVEPSWDDENMSFRCWAHPESCRTGDLDIDDEVLINIQCLNVPDKEPFDAKEFTDSIYWSVFDVLLMVEHRNGTFERIGIG